ncbi:MAG: PKD domain-containing protein [Proteobacteria bacterium]|nr:PKD domain-containing protein [Pseudomonadota bacterium]
MSTSHLFVKYVRLLGVIQLSVFLVSCDGEPITLATVAVTASVNEGFNPLTVTFDVRGPSIIISGATWDFGDDEEVQTICASSITHTFVNPGRIIVGVTVNASDPSSGDFIFEIPINVLPNVNLIVSSFAIDTDLTPGGLETISAIIQNIGTDTFTQFETPFAHIDVGYYLSTDDIITVDDIFIGDTSIFVGAFFTGSDIPFGVQSLAPGEIYQYDHQLAVKGNVPAGTYFAGAIVDYIDEFHWYNFPRSTNTSEVTFPSHAVVPETDEGDNVRLLTAHQVTVTAPVCVDDLFEADDNNAAATLISVGDIQVHNFCFDNSDWLQFDAVQGNVYKITTSSLGAETDTQLILYDTDGSSILLFHDNMGNTDTLDLKSGFPPFPESEIVWEAQVTGTYFIKVRTTACDEDSDNHCSNSPDGVGLDTEYSITLQ